MMIYGYNDDEDEGGDEDRGTAWKRGVRVGGYIRY